MKQAHLGLLIGVLLVTMTAGCAAPAATPVPVPAATAVPPTPQIISAGFTPASVCAVPSVVGLDQSMAQGLLAKLGLQPVLSNQYDAGTVEGTVISQKPAAGTRMEPCKGYVDVVVSIGPAPTLTPLPATATPRPTATPEPTATPANTPTPLPSPTPNNRVFFDDFETGIQSAWNMRGNYGLVNGDLVVAGDFVEGSVGDSSWTNYEITLDIASVDNFELATRIQDADNYMRFRWWYDNGAYFDWAKMIGGKETPIPASGTKVWACCSYPSNRSVRIELRGGNYRVFINGDQQLSFIDSTFAAGGIGFKSKGITLRSFEVRSLQQ